MEEYRVTICVKAPNKQEIEDWLSILHYAINEIPEFFWTIDDVEKGSAFD